MNISKEELDFMKEAMRNYKNPHCLEIEEFYEDVSRVKSIVRTFTKYKKTGVINERLILNHITILYNMFEEYATEMLFKKVPEEYYAFLKPFLILKGCLPEGKILIESDKFIEDRLGRI